MNTTNNVNFRNTNFSNKNINRKKGIQKTLIASVIVSVLATAPTMAYAENANNEIGFTVETELTLQEKHQRQVNNENIGFGSGMLIGALAAGPVGAIVAGVTGIFVGKFINANDDVEEMSLALAQQKSDHQQKITRVKKQHNKKLQQVEQNYQAELLAFEQTEYIKGQLKSDSLQAQQLLMSLQFSTGSSDIAPHYQEQVSALAQLLNNTPSMQVDLSGYTDLIGDSTLNQTLSLARVTSVKKLLMAQGVNEEQIALFAFGENAPVVASDEHEVSFYDRRVVMKVHNGQLPLNSQTAKN
ncbi:MAG: sortase-associated OmpA-like protein PdsO [Colwellia sp.]